MKGEEEKEEDMIIVVLVNFVIVAVSRGLYYQQMQRTVHVGDAVFTAFVTETNFIRFIREPK